ncbi:MAG TPA: DUF58 domain-containing protein [Candidatus Cloacimonadota bacterium]|mgnify:CR=1 FL=1|nr:DUF58 domain-containing protein [Candidatus Cloacimonadota bacterium]HPS38521.1 DUF58 domain-containing protein [Candidatus Cloacimonadota bacterium]
MLTQSPAEILKRIKKIEIRTKNVVSELFSGEYRSSFKGQGLEFAEVREYQPGDSYRMIDWNVSARYGVPFIKKFRETRELNVFFIIDSSSSLDFGTRSVYKKERLAEITAVLSFSALSNNDMVGLIMYSTGPEKYLPPRKGRNSALQILREILYHEPHSAGTSLSGAFEYTARILKKRSIVFILSDFLDTGWEDPLRILSQKHDVIAIQILDDAELKLPRAGILRLVDPETGQEIYVNSSSAELQRRYAKATTALQAKLRDTLKKLQVDHIQIKNSESYIDALRSFFEIRAMRLHNRR